ncbi:MAG: 3-deoxy-manno-octulosonate cytidylyltransferase [Planctomycetia bacterium]|nr:3-deoxy-manno-octulosonate cytidylyltransferase [Planctomycetia bacterium]
MPSVFGSTRQSSYVVIPARLHSTRLQGKLLLRETGRTLIQHTYEAACRARKPAGVLVATEDVEIATEVRYFGGSVVLTAPGYQSGTDRIASVASDEPLASADIIVNVQGDEPEIEAEAIDRLIGLLEANPGTAMATLATPIRRRELLLDPACVKVVCDQSGHAMYFSRAAIPHAREWHDDLLTIDSAESKPASFHQHIGVYAYRREFLLQLGRLPRSPLERLENLEQLRVLENGQKIAVGIVLAAAPGIDTPADYAAFIERQARRQVA